MVPDRNKRQVHQNSNPQTNNNNSTTTAPRSQHQPLMNLMSAAACVDNNNLMFNNDNQQLNNALMFNSNNQQLNNDLLFNNNNQQLNNALMFNNNNNQQQLNNAPLFSPQNFYMYNSMPTNMNPPQQYYNSTAINLLPPPNAQTTQQIMQDSLSRQLNAEKQTLLQLQQSLAQARTGLAQNSDLWLLKANAINELTKSFAEKIDIIADTIPALDAQIEEYINGLRDAAKRGLDACTASTIAIDQFDLFSKTILTLSQDLYMLVEQRTKLLSEAQDMVKTLNRICDTEPTERLGQTIPLLTTQISAQHAKIQQLQQQLDALTMQTQTGGPSRTMNMRN